MGVSSVAWMLNKMGLLSRDIPHGDSAFVYRTTSSIDRSFGLHAFFGLLWICVAFAQIVPIQSFSLARHRQFGIFALLSFVGHMSASINNVISDEAEHHPMSKMMLLSSVCLSIVHMARSIFQITKRDVTGHKDNAVLAFLFSIEGAGTIRTVQHIQLFFKIVLPPVFAGPSDCQNMYGGKATHCAESYCLRLVFVRIMTFYWIGMYARCCKKDSGFTIRLLFESMFTMLIGASLAVALSNAFLKDGFGASTETLLLLGYWSLTSVCMLLPRRAQKSGNHAPDSASALDLKIKNSSTFELNPTGHTQTHGREELPTWPSPMQTRSQDTLPTLLSPTHKTMKHCTNKPSITD